jgi:hypothetical protein
MSRFSMAYIRAIAAASGYSVLETSSDEDLDSVDGKLVSFTGTRPQIDFQAKATSQYMLGNDGIHFPLPVKNYDDLRADTRTPRILIVLLMPRDDTDWLTQTDTELCLRRCCYWVSLPGRPSVPNTSSVTIQIPTANMFDRTQLDDLMSKANEGRPL